MKLWIVGKNGMLSKAFQQECAKQKIAFIATDRGEVDITSWESIKNFQEEGITHVINASGYTQVDEAEKKSADAHALNAIGPEYLAAYANQKKIPLIHFSTDYVFDGKKTEAYTEEDAPNPLSVYGMTKWLGEKAIQEQCKEHLIVRISWLFGPGKNFVLTMLKLFKERKELSIVADQIGSPTYAVDVARFILANLHLRGLYHYAGVGSATWHLFAVSILTEVKKRGWEHAIEALLPISKEQYPTPATRPNFSLLSTAKLQREKLHTRSWVDSLEEYLNTLEVSRGV